MLHLNNKKMRLRTIHEKINVEKWTLGDFGRYFEVSAETFMDALKKRTGTQLKTYTEGLERNERLSKVCSSTVQSAKKSASDMPTAKETAVSSKKEVPQPESSVKAEETATVVKEEVNPNPEEAKKGSESEREIELGMEIEILREEVALLEANSNRIDALIAEKNIAKQKIQSELESYLQKVKDAKERFVAIEEQVVQLTSESEKTIEEYSAKSEELSKKEAELESCRTVEIYFDSNGLHVSKEEFIPSKDAIGAKHLELSELEEYEFCAVRDVKAIAAISATISLLKNAGAKYAIAYEKCPETVSQLLNGTAA